MTTGTDSTAQPDAATEQFQRLAAAVHEECAYFSSMHQVAQHPAYVEIVGMGPRALPLILKELERRPAHWFWALHAITQENPVLPEHRGVIAEMAQDWLNWAEEKGLQW